MQQPIHHAGSDPWPGQGHRYEVNWRYMFRSRVLPACSRDPHFSVLVSHRYSQKDPYRNRPLGLLTCARQTLTERNRLRGILGVAISIYPREDVFIRENGRPTFRLRCRSKVSASITSPQRNIVSLSLRSRCTLSKYNIDCKKIF